MSLASEFMTFLKNYQVIGLAVAVIIGGAATTFVTALVNDVIMPVVAVLVPGGDWQTAEFMVGPVKFLLGHLAGAILNFLIIAAVVFMVVKYVMKADATKKV